MPRSSLPTRLRATLATAGVVVAGLAVVGISSAPALAAGTATWTGASSQLWSDPGNWSGGTPAPGDGLVFPAGAVQTTTVNDLAPGTSFDSLVVAAPGYDISGNAIAIANTLSATYATGSSTSDLDLSFGAGAVDVASGGSLSVDGAITGASGLTLGGGGTLRLSSPANTYSGDTLVGEGVLQVDGTITSRVVLAGGTLTGSGSLDGPGITGLPPSTITPGTAQGPGDLRYRANTGLTLPSSSTLHIDIEGPTAGTGYDRLRLTSGSALFNPNGAVLDVDLGYLPTVNTSYQIVSQTFGSPITGRFNGISQFGSFVEGPATFSVGYFNSGVILTVVAVSSVPTASVVVADDSLTAGESSLVTVAFNAPVTGFTNADLTDRQRHPERCLVLGWRHHLDGTFTPAASTTDATNVITLDKTGVRNAAGHAGYGTTNSNNYAVDTVRPTASIVVADDDLHAGETSLSPSPSARRSPD